MQRYLSWMGGLALGLVLFSCDAGEKPIADPEAYAREKSARTIRTVEESQVVATTYKQGRALRDGVKIALPKITSRPSGQQYFAFDTTQWTGVVLDPKMKSLLDSYLYQWEQQQSMEDNVQRIQDSLMVYSYPTDSGIHLVTYPRKEIILALD